jgi:hypothetical protein
MRNRHFANTDDEFGDVPSPARLYAVVDHLEVGPLSTLVAFDCVDADWLDGQRQNPYFAADNFANAEKLWRRFWVQRLPAIPSPLDNMPVYRLELEVVSLASFSDVYSSLTSEDDQGIAAIETAWIALDVVPSYTPDSHAGDLYHGMFLPPRHVYVATSVASSEAVATLNLITDLSHLPVAGPSDLRKMVDSQAEAEYLGVFNVGQGGASGLLNARHEVSLYYDLGCGVYRNAWTAPTGLNFCWSINRTIVLSHWDADHWAGAQVPLPGYPPHAPVLPALARHWIVPVQKIGPVHLAFANSIAAGHLWSLGATAACSIAGGRQVTLTLGSGSSRNHSGIVLLTEDSAGGPAWLLSGDCDYKYFSGTLALSNVIALTAPHHGASLGGGSAPPTAPAAAYQRVVYSFGINNSHGKSSVSHPTTKGVAAHDAAGWQHGPVWPTAAKPGSTSPTDDALATSIHTVGVSRSTPPTTWDGGVIVGWSQPTTSSPCACFPLLSQF